MKLDHTAVINWASEAVLKHGRQMSKAFCDKFDVTRTTAAKALKRLVAEGWLESSGGTRPVYSPGKNRQIVHTYNLPGIEEDVIWRNDFGPYFDLPENIANIAYHGFTEMVNNANDHSQGKAVSVLMRQEGHALSIVVWDDGIGIFKKITDAMGLPDPRLALLELSKGKFTTDPANHSGEGVFFTSRMFDHFEIDANNLQYEHNINKGADVIFEMPAQTGGTMVGMYIPLNSKRTPKEVFDDFSGADGDYGFDQTVVPVRLARIGKENLVSRSQAKRLVARFEGFKTVVLDFTEVPEIGQAFADEVFRVFANSHPHVELIPVKANSNVQQMINRALAVAGSA